MKKYIKCVVVLTAICAVVAVLLAAVNYITKPVIDENARKAAEKALAEVLPGGENFEVVDLSEYTVPGSVLEVQKASNGGYVVKTSVDGYAPDMIIMCGIDENGVVVGTKYLSGGETNKAEKTYGEKLVGKTASDIDAVDTVAGSTKTTGAYKSAVKDSLNTVAILGGATVDLRTDEEKMADALPAANGEFEKLFVPVELDGVSAVYKAKNDSGYVYVTESDFVAVDNDGNVISEVSAEVKAVVEAAVKTVSENTLTPVDITAFALPESVIEAATVANGSCVITVKVKGYKDGMVIKCSVGSDGTLISSECIESNETNGAEKTYGEKLVGVSVDTVDAVDTVAGSTMTTTAYKSAVKDALLAAAVLGGGDVDVRTEEQILADNLSAALPAADGEFEELFMVEVHDGVSAAYKAINGSGYVFVIGETFVGADANGKIVSEATTEEKAAATAAASLIIASSVTEIDLSKYSDIPSAIVAAYKTESGNFVFDVKGSGYGITGDKYSKSGEYIYIKVSISADGKIIDCLTVSQKESEGIGDKCAAPEFYSQFDGKTADNYKEIDTISGATKTTDGYLTAISRAFEAFNILK